MSRALVVLGLSCSLLAALPEHALATPEGWWDPQWVSRADFTIIEPGVVDRSQEYVDLTLDFPPDSITDPIAEVRVIDSMGTELPSLVHSQVGDQAHVLINLDLPMGASETIHVYFGNRASVPPAYVFPDLPAIFYVNDPDFLGNHEINLESNYEALSIYGQISFSIELANANLQYDSAQAQTLRVAFVTGSCAAATSLSMTSIYQDVSIWGVSNGSCLEINLFGLVDDTNDPLDVQVPPVTSYVTQDFLGNQTLSYACDEAATPNAGGIPELVSAEDPMQGCMLRFDSGHTLPNMQTLAFRSFFSGLIDPFGADAVAIHTRAAEFVLQENRVDVLFGVFETIDLDGDTVLDRDDNCVDDANPDQADADMDGIGDVCDGCPDDADNDVDGDTICGDVDNCPEVDNPDQADADEDGQGDACQRSDDTTGDATAGVDSTGAVDSTGDAGGSTGLPTDGAMTTSISAGSGSAEGSTGGGPAVDDGGGNGCGCRSDDRPVGPLAGLLLGLGLIRRRRRAR
ncbi:MAG: thrombospondin type 3 repeat-containing protein [Myxococcota bacterium]